MAMAQHLVFDDFSQAMNEHFKAKSSQNTLRGVFYAIYSKFVPDDCFFRCGGLNFILQPSSACLEAPSL